MMVVNRKQPVAPVPLIQSRSTSQQPIVMRKTLVTTANGTNSPSTNSIPKSKSMPQRRRRKKPLRDKLFLWSLSLFALYSFIFCSPYTTTFQQSQSNLVCRVESNYKTYILEPAFSFSHSLAKPYISQVEPYLAPVTYTVKPYIIKTYKRVWKGTLIPFYKHILKPYYHSAILPRYNIYLRPYLLPLVAHLERYYTYYISNPIRIQSNRVQLLYSTYHPYIHPYIHRFTSALHTTWLSSLYIYRTHLQPTLLSTWIRAQPLLSFAFDQAKDISLNAAAKTAKHLKGLANQVGTQRRTYVDPHIRKIWDKVEENSTTKLSTAPLVDISLEEETVESTSDEAVVSTKEPGTLPIDVPEEAQTVFHPAESTPPPPDSPSPSQETRSAINIVETFVGGSTVDVPTSGTIENSESKPTEVIQAEPQVEEETPNHEPITSTSAQAEAESTSLVGVTITRGAGGVLGVGASSASSSHSTTEGEDDLDDFLRDIGIDLSASPSSPPSPSPALTQLSEAEQAAEAASVAAAAQEAESSRLAAIASKRLAITTRHTTFENNLQSSIAISTSQIIEKLNEMREIKKKELIHMMEGTNEREGLVVELTLSGDKLMKGLDVYLTKCQGRSETWKQRGGEEEDIEKRTGLAKDELTRLEAVIEKVEDKFMDAVYKVQEQVTGWYSDVIEKEQNEISIAAAEIKSMADKAQADLGLDYAWLEDVTYMDWRRYHDLMTVSEIFSQTANAIQNGTSLNPPSPPNPIKSLINELQEELQTVILRFHVALNNVSSRIPELFSIYGSAGEEDEVRIQPIDPDADGENGQEGFDASKIIIGKSKEQIEQALGDVPLVVKHEEL